MSTKRSKTLESAGSIETGGYSASCFGLSTLGTGEMCAVFQMRGNYELEMHTLMIRSKRTSKEISNLFYILDGNLVNASRTVQSK